LLWRTKVGHDECVFDKPSLPILFCCEQVAPPNGVSMKVNMEIECTPIEARQFLGLPNVEPMQAAVMQQLEKRMLADIDRFSPEALMKSWLAIGPQTAEQIQSFFRSVLSPPRTTDQTDEKP
jgi:Family of unknown function (DUF6489)